MKKARKSLATSAPPTPLSVPMTEFVSNPAATYAKVKAGQRLVLTGADKNTKIVIFPGTLADYASRD